MPYNTATGVYTPPNGAENAFPGEVIASATWNAIFTDIANALTQVGQGQITILPRSITVAGNATIAITDRIVLIQANVGTLSLPSASTKVSPLTIIGNSAGIFASHNMIVSPAGVETIDGLAGVTMSTNYQTITLLPLSGGGWLQQG